MEEKIITTPHCSKVKEKENECALNINKGDLLVTDNLINSGMSVNVKDSQGRSALHVAVDCSMLFLPRPFGYLLDAKCYSNLSLALVKLLISYGADTNIKNEYEKSVLHSAIECKNFKAAKMLVHNCADVNFIDQYGHTSLFYAIINCNLELVSIILRNGGKTDLIDVFGKTVLHFAVETNNVDIVNYITDYIPDIYDFILIKNNIGESCLHLAVKNNNYAMVKVLLDLGADVNQEDQHGMTPLLKVNRDLVLKHQNRSEEVSVKEFECSSCQIIKLLLNKGANINHLSQFYLSALQQAIKGNHACGVKLLIDMGSSINDDRIHPPCSYTAIKNQNVEIIAILLENGADIYNSKFLTPEMYGSAVLSDISFDVLKPIFRLLSRWFSTTSQEGFFSLQSNIEKTKLFLYLEISVKRHLRNDDDSDGVIEMFNNYFDLLNIRYNEQCLETFNVLINYGSLENVRYDNHVSYDPSPQNSYFAVLNKYRLMTGHLYNLKSLLDCNKKNEPLNTQIIKEIEKLKRSNICDDNDCTYYDILTKDSKICSMMLYHNNFLKNYLTCDKWRVNFPIYAPLLDNKLQRIFLRSSLLAHSHLFFDSLHNKLGYPKLAPLCIDKITYLLSTGALSCIKKTLLPFNKVKS